MLNFFSENENENFSVSKSIQMDYVVRSFWKKEEKVRKKKFLLISGQ